MAHNVQNDSEKDKEAAELDKELVECMCKLSMYSSLLQYHGELSGLLVFICSMMVLAPKYSPQHNNQYSWLKIFVENDFPVLLAYTFPLPTSDLLSTLVDLFFAHVNSHYPVLHQPTFTMSITTSDTSAMGASAQWYCWCV
ncbi:hypothetical protein GSI_05692 [Ganoderma sinense ZZ0214-1]|uniref:Uncharacterized protein n=1 Tax=Ganoderma sinense ZZ0214-1 TaxID=1077348 RepID=A0A2G8SB60_9APHY|nr:hypothetical protein GSI_05692 [Ganoderma sinense ZZ0214-1]